MFPAIETHHANSRPWLLSLKDGDREQEVKERQEGKERQGYGEACV